MPGVNKKTIREYWSKNAPGWDNAVILDEKFFNKADDFRKSNEPYVLPLIESLSKVKGRVLEVGCGLGADSRNFSKRGMRVVGSDLSLENAKLTKKGFEAMGLKGSIVCSDAENLPFKDGSFEAYYSFGVLHHTPNTAKAIGEAYRVLKKGGKCVVMLYHKGYAYLYINLIYGFKSPFVTKEKLISDHYDFTPLSKMYSKKEAKKLFKKFRSIEFEVTTFAYGGVSADKKLRIMHKLLKNPS